MAGTKGSHSTPRFPTLLLLWSGSRVQLGPGSPAGSRTWAGQAAGHRLLDGPCTEPWCGRARGTWGEDYIFSSSIQIMTGL